LDGHFGTIATWRKAIDEIHARNMYVLLDNTFATMGDLIGFDGYLNTTTPFLLREHEVMWKSDRQYTDFGFGNTYNASCEYPRFWLETGERVDASVTDQMNGCFDSDFDQYGDTEAFGVFPDWRRQLSKFASVQDRLREWHEPVRFRLENFYCILIAQLDVDGFRYDKATQSTIDAMGYMNDAMRTCARRYGKENFFLPGEITGGNVFGSLYIGRGREPDQVPENLTTAVSLTNNSADQYFIRDAEYGALDSAAFHYTVYRTLTRFLGMDGNLEAGYDAPPNWVDMWNTFLLTNDFVNANTGEFDPRHMYGVTNQDVFRWPAIRDGIHRQLLGHFITTIHMPGIPLLLWGEEQAFYVLDNTADNYIFGRQAMSAATAWQTHGCYVLDSTQYFHMPLEDARNGCRDENTSKDHRDPSAPVRNVLRHMHQLRESYPVLNDGFYLQQLSNQTELIQYPGSGTVTTETGMWSTMRSTFPGLQDLSGDGLGNFPVWLLYSNMNASTTFVFDCANNATALNTTALLSPYDAGTTVKNLFYPYDEQTLEPSVHILGINASTKQNGCLAQLDMAAYDFRAYVPLATWSGPQAMITKFLPGHDYRILSSSNSESVDIEIQFSVEMSCDSVTENIVFTSKTSSGTTPTINKDSVSCGILSHGEVPAFVGAIGSAWSYKATIDDVADGVHALTVRNASAQDGSTTNSNDRFLLRVGKLSNPVVFPGQANYSKTLLSKKDDGTMLLSHTAAGADSWRYSTNWGSSFSDWQTFDGAQSTIQPQNWTGTNLQAWKGEHVRVEYFSRLAGSSDIVQEGDVDFSKQRRFPHMFLNGPYNQYGYDAGLTNEMTLTEDATWEHYFMTEWPAVAQINVWGMNSDGKPDQSIVMGDADGDSILDRLPPSSLASVALNITLFPPRPYLGWKIVVNDGNLRFKVLPYGNMWLQLALYVLLWTLPVIMGSTAVWAFMQSFYGVKFNEIGVAEKGSMILTALRSKFQKVPEGDEEKPYSKLLARLKPKTKFINTKDTIIEHVGRRRTVLIATMEYDIEDWAIKIKIGGLGVMAQLMGKNLSHQDLIWVVPCVGGVDYPEDESADPMEVTILNELYEVKVQYHTLRNIKYVLLDSPVFRKQTKTEPYPPRMDDLSSAVYYSAWNQCIAQAIERFPIDLYHINDYHGTIAPLYLLPRTIPAALSLHNAEFQGLWPMRTKKERDECCSVFNLSQDVVQKYVQFGEVFNLLHAGASYIRVNQEGFGAVGVSKKYGKRSYARYPIFWGLKKVGQLPNPDPSDTGEWDKQLPKEEDIKIDRDFEAGRFELKRQAQEWANLDQNPTAELFVFVGRWSVQKGVDLIADVFPNVLAADKNVQLICIGPIVDLYGKFAALKLAQLMKVFPGRVYSKPEFTALPPYIFSGAEFALIPSRDEPFGLVAVEFGRKGALGVGARVGGLGQMPGWWYTVESTTTSHLVHQFRMAIREALDTKTETRAMMRARSAKQRFPVAQWVESLEILQSTAIRLHDKVAINKRHSAHSDNMASWSGTNSAVHSRVNSSQKLSTRFHKLQGLSETSNQDSYTSGQLSRKVSLGSHRGPGHVSVQDLHDAVLTLPAVRDVEIEEPNVGLAISHDFDSDSDEEERGLEMPRSALQARRGVGDFGITSNMSSTSIARHNDMTSPLGTPGTPAAEFELLQPPTPTFLGSGNHSSSRLSALSLDTVVGNKTDFNLQKVDPFFTDSNGAFTAQFTAKLATLDANNSEDTCIEEFLVKSEKKWFDEFRNAKLGRHSRTVSRQSSFQRERGDRSAAPSISRFSDAGDETDTNSDDMDQFMLGKDYVPPTGAQNWMQRKM
jgi:alpha-1,3-glucan synthase